MKILITHLTRMNFPRICVAGRDIETLQSIRPITSKNDILDVFMLDRFVLGGVVDLGKTAPLPQPPEVEDHLFDPLKVQRLEGLPHRVFWQQLESVAKPSLHDIFGQALKPSSHTYYLEPHSGTASLGEWQTEGATLVLIGDAPNQKLRLKVGELSLPVTDIRLYQEVGGEFVPNTEAIHLCNRILRRSSLILSVGLSRAWAKQNAAPMHWLQVNSIHLKAAPIWGTQWNIKN